MGTLKPACASVFLWYVADKILFNEIEDNGPGVPLEMQKRIFEPFFTTKPPGSGTGLGLSVSYAIIANNHHGRLEVHSYPGSGCCFMVKLPLTRKTGATP